MKIICRQDYLETLLKRLKDYQDLDITLIEKGQNYQGFGYVFSMDKLEELIKDLEGYRQSKGTLIGYQNDRLFIINIQNIFYIEGLEKDVYFYTKDKEYLSKSKLYELEQFLENTSFIRVSKSTIVNLRHIEYMMPEANMRYSIFLTNGIRVILSRKYLKQFKERVKLK